MKIRIEKSFAKDVDHIRDKNALKKLRALLEVIEHAKSIQEIQHIKKIEGHDSFYRIKIGDYRVGMEISRKEAVLIRCLHRKDIYRYFPKKG